MRLRGIIVVLVVLFLGGALQTAAQHIQLNVNPGRLILPQADEAEFEVTIIPQGGFNASVLLSAETPTLGGDEVEFGFSSNPANPPQYNSVTMTLKLTVDASVGVHEITVKGANGTISASKKIMVEVTPLDDWKVYNTDNSDIPSNNVTGLSFQGDQNLWIGTTEGLARFDEINWEIFTTENSAIAGNHVNSLLYDNDRKELWVATKSGLSYFDGSDWTTSDVAGGGLPDNNARALNLASDGTLWLLAGENVVKLKDGLWTAYNGANASIPDQGLVDITVDEINHVWLLVPYGLYQFDGNEWTQITKAIVSPVPHHVFSDHKGSIWYAMALAGVYRLQDDILTPLKNPAFDTWHPSYVTIDHEGYLWSTGHGDAANDVPFGLVRIDLEEDEWQDYNTDNSKIPVNNVNMIATSEEFGVWVATSGGGLISFEEANYTPILTETDVWDQASPPLALAQNAPNPASSSTTIAFSLLERTEVRLQIYDQLGQLVAVPVNGVLGAGEHRMRIDTGDLPNGAYWYRLEGPQTTLQRQMIVLR